MHYRDETIHAAVNAASYHGNPFTMHDVRVMLMGEANAADESHDVEIRAVIDMNVDEGRFVLVRDTPDAGPLWRQEWTVRRPQPEHVRPRQVWTARRPQSEHVRPLGAPPVASPDVVDTQPAVTQLLIRKALDKALASFDGGPIAVRDVRFYLLGAARAHEPTFTTEIYAMLASLESSELVLLPGERWRKRRPSDDAVVQSFDMDAPDASPAAAHDRDTVDRIALDTFGADSETIFNALCDKFRAERTTLSEQCQRIAQKIAGESDSYETLIQTADALARNATQLRALIEREHHAFLGATEF